MNQRSVEIVIKFNIPGNFPITSDSTRIRSLSLGGVPPVMVVPTTTACFQMLVSLPPAAMLVMMPVPSAPVRASLPVMTSGSGGITTSSLL